MLAILAFVFIGTAFASQECPRSGNVNIANGCRSYVMCRSGVASGVVNCGNCGGTCELVFNSDTGICERPEHVAQPCGNVEVCTGRGSRKFADLATNCKSYYTCNRDVFFGHNQCPPGLVFDESMQTCNWPRDVLPPCGYKGVTTPSGK